MNKRDKQSEKLSTNLREAQAQLNAAYQAAIKELKVDQVIDELVKDYRPKGDLFYSDISRRLKDRLGKKYPAEAFGLACDALRGAGLKIWGD